MYCTRMLLCVSNKASISCLYMYIDLSMASFLSTEFSESLTGGVGTALYRAPEQEGRSKESAPDASVPHSAAVRGARTYDAKADMFSLGIILFEMYHEPFSTGMERVKTLCALRGVDSVVPLDFTTRIPENLVHVIKWLVQTDPARRPTAAELQASPLMPPRIQLDKNYLEEVMHALTIPNSDICRRVVSTLFCRKETTMLLSEHEDMTYDLDLMSSTLRALKLDHPWVSPVGTSDVSVHVGSSKHSVHSFRKTSSFPDSSDTLAETSSMMPSLILEAIQNITEDVFLSHGASMLSPSLLHPRDSVDRCGDTHNADMHCGIGLHCSHIATWQPLQRKNDILSDKIAPPVVDYVPAELMDKTGTVVMLPSEHVTAYARYVARLGVMSATRFLIEPVYRERVRKHVATGQLLPQHPQQSIEAVFDIIRENESHHIRSTASLPDAADYKPIPESEKRAFIESEVIMAAVEIANGIDPKNAVGHKFLRVGDSRLGNAILDLCAAPYPRDNIIRTFSAIADEAITSHIIGSRNKALSVSDHDLIAQANQMVDAVGLPREVRRALRPFVNILAVSTNARASIVAIEKVVYSILDYVCVKFDM